MENVRVRFAPSPTGGLHIGGLRTALFNYLFAKKNLGKFILRIEDTDRARFVEGAEEYILKSLEWCGIHPDESPFLEGGFAPYRQSERKNMYKQYAEQLLAEGNAYYAFDTPDELEAMRDRLTKARIVKPQYNTLTRGTMKNSLTLSESEVNGRLENGESYAIRIKVPKDEEIRLNDLVRGWVKVNSDEIDDKVLMKSDGMPTYHLANVVDDFLMKITHVIRGEEWLPSAPLHVLLYQYLGWAESMPKFAHLPLILKPDGNGKLSKRAADKAGFPIFPLNWTDIDSEELVIGFKETGFLPEALINFLAFLGWNPGTEQEIFSMDELIQSFSIDRINKGGTKFDFDKARWYNQQYIKSTPDHIFGKQLVLGLNSEYQIACDLEKAEKIIDLLKERVTYPQDFLEASLILFQPPKSYDDTIRNKKWNQEASIAMKLFADALQNPSEILAEEAKNLFWKTLESNGYKPGQFMQTLRFTITGQGSGPDLMSIIEIMGPKNSANRIKYTLNVLNEE